jgi:hypothetical protein
MAQVDYEQTALQGEIDASRRQDNNAFAIEMAQHSLVASQTRAERKLEAKRLEGELSAQMASLDNDQRRFAAGLKHDVISKRIDTQAQIAMVKLKNTHDLRLKTLEAQLEKAKLDADNEAQARELESSIATLKAENEQQMNMLRAESEVRMKEEQARIEEVKRQERNARRKKCLADLADGTRPNAQCDMDGYITCVHNHYPTPHCSKTCRPPPSVDDERLGIPLKRVIEGDCKCPADNRFRDAYACRSTPVTYSDVEAESKCLDRYTGHQCDKVRWPAERVELDGDGLVAPSFEARCPFASQFVDRDACEATSTCREGYRGEACNICLAWDGSSMRTTYLRPTQTPTGSVQCKCPPEYHFKDQTACGPRTNEQDESDDARFAIECEEGYAHLSKQEPFCQVCAPGYEQRVAEDGTMTCVCPNPPKYGSGCDTSAECQRSEGAAPDAPSELIAPACDKCKNANMTWDGAKCVCTNPFLKMKEACSTAAPPGSVLTEGGIAKYEMRSVILDTEDYNWQNQEAYFPGTDGVDADGKPIEGVPACNTPCTFATEAEALAAMPFWSEAAGFGKALDGRFYPLRESQALRDSARAMVGSGPGVPYRSVYLKLCEDGRDPDDRCQSCTFPLVFDEADPNCDPADGKGGAGCKCVCPKSHDPKHCAPDRCRPGSGLDPGTKCTKCVNPNMEYNAEVGRCECASTSNFDAGQCGGLDGTQELRCRPGSRLDPATACTTLIRPVPSIHYYKISQGYTMEGASGRKREGVGQDLVECRSQCSADVSCRAFDFRDGECMLYASDPKRKHGEEVVVEKDAIDAIRPDEVADRTPAADDVQMTAARRRIEQKKRENRAEQRKKLRQDELKAATNSGLVYLKRDNIVGLRFDGTCPANTVFDALTGECVCDDANLDPMLCQRKFGGDLTVYEHGGGDEQISFIDPDGEDPNNPSQKCRKMGKQLAEIHSVAAESALDEMAQPGSTYFVNARVQNDEMTWLRTETPVQREVAAKAADDAADDDAFGQYSIVLKELAGGEEGGGGGGEEGEGGGGGGAGDVLSSTDVCLVVHKPADGGKIQFRKSPCASREAGQVCEDNTRHKCRNATLNPRKGCQECKNRTLTFDADVGVCYPREAEPSKQGNPDWNPRSTMPPVTAHVNKASNQLPFLLQTADFLHSRKLMLEEGERPDVTCAQECLRLGEEEGFKCQGFLYTENFTKLRPGVMSNRRQCSFFSNRAGLDDGQVEPFAGVTTYSMDFCRDASRQYWDKDEPCAHYISSLKEPGADGKGACPKAMRDTFQCDPTSECANPGTKSRVDCSIHPETEAETCGDCTEGDCIDGVVDGEDGSRCSKCDMKHALGVFTNNMRDCGICDEENGMMIIGGDTQAGCQCVRPGRDPARQCKVCLGEKGGKDCMLSAKDCSYAGFPQMDDTCKCDIERDGHELHVDSGDATCARCKAGYGPAPQEDARYPCSVLKTQCDASVLFADKQAVLNKLAEKQVDAKSIIVMKPTSKPGDVQCDCTGLNAQLASVTGTRGHWTGAQCNVCNHDQAGGQLCNIPNSVCNNNGHPSDNAVDETDPQCVCDTSKGYHYSSNNDTCEPGGECAPNYAGYKCEYTVDACEGGSVQANAGANGRDGESVCDCADLRVESIGNNRFRCYDPEPRKIAECNRNGQWSNGTSCFSCGEDERYNGANGCEKVPQEEAAAPTSWSDNPMISLVVGVSSTKEPKYFAGGRRQQWSDKEGCANLESNSTYCTCGGGFTMVKAEDGSGRFGCARVGRCNKKGCKQRTSTGFVRAFCKSGTLRTWRDGWTGFYCD